MRKSKMRPVSNVGLSSRYRKELRFPRRRNDKAIVALFIKKQIPNLSPRSALTFLQQTPGVDLSPLRDRVDVIDFTRISSNSFGGSWENPSYFTVKLRPSTYQKCLVNDSLVPLTRQDVRTLAYHWPPFFPSN